MQISNRFVLATSLCFASAAASIQPACAAFSVTAQTTSTAPSGVLPGVPTASGLLRPSLDDVQQTLTAMKLDRWKRGTVRTEAGDRIAQILRDIHDTLPSLLTTADAAPEAVSKQLPVSRNIDALYDVLLRVYEAARVSAPDDQIMILDKSLAGLNKARLAFDDGLQDSATSTEKQVSELQTKVKAQAAFTCPAPAPAPVCPKPAPPKPRRKPKPPTTPQAAPSSTPANAKPAS